MRGGPLGGRTILRDGKRSHQSSVRGGESWEEYEDEPADGCMVVGLEQAPYSVKVE